MQERLQFVIQFSLFLFDTVGLQSKFLLGMMYDGAANMGGITGNVQAIMKEKLAVKTENGNVFAPYVRCSPHQINLFIVRAIVDAINSFWFCTRNLQFR